MAEDVIVAKTNPEPWREFEVKYERDGVWSTMGYSSFFNDAYMYRRKPVPPKTMKIGGIVVEACPLKEMKVGDEYFEVVLYYGTWLTQQDTGRGVRDSVFSNRSLKAGYIFATQQEAQAVADALNKLYKKAVDEAWGS